MIIAKRARQSSMIAYVDDFQLMLYLTLAVLPLLLFIRTPPRANARMGDTHAVIE